MSWTTLELSPETLEALEKEPFLGPGGFFEPERVEADRAAGAKALIGEKLINLMGDLAVAYGGETQFLDAIAGETVLATGLQRLLGMAYLHMDYSAKFVATGNRDERKAQYWMGRLVGTRGVESDTKAEPGALAGFERMARSLLVPATTPATRHSQSVVVSNATFWQT